MTSSINAIVFIDLQANITAVNRSFLKLWRYDNEYEVLGKPAIEFWQTEEKALEVLKTLRDNGSWIGELVAIRKDGSTFDVQLSASIIRDQDGKPIRMMASFVDISEPKRAEEALRESEDKFAKAFHSSPNPYAITALRDGGFIEVNDSFLGAIGYGREEVVGHTARELGIWPGEEDRRRIAPILREEGRIHNSEIIFRTRSGEIRRGVFSAEIISLSGELCILTTINDVTERRRAEDALRESEEKLRLMFESVTDGITVTNLEAKIVQANEATVHMHGYGSKVEVIGRNSFDFIAKRDHPRARENLRATLETGCMRNLKYTLLKKDGSEFPGELSAAIFRDASSKTAGFIAITRDITERKRMEEELRIHRDRLEELVQERTAELKVVNEQLQQELIERKKMEEVLWKAKDAADVANRAKSEFLARMSHEIRTPIHGVMGTIGLLLDTELRQEQRQFVEMARSSAESLLGIINDILDFSKIEARQIKLEETDFDLRYILEQAMETMAVAAHKKGLEITCQLPLEVPTALLGDAGRLRQILVNLIGNAVKFTDQGEVVVYIDVEDCRKAEVQLHFAVHDTGIGIPKDKQHLIFNPFQQADGSADRRYGGTGLGLAISRELVKKMKGRIWMTSRVREGSTFHFVARFKKQARGNHASDRPRVPGDLQGLPVLLVDDNGTSRLILRELLRHWGLEVTDTGDGPAALKILKKVENGSRRFRLVLLDKTMPGMDGFAVAEQIRDDATLRDVVMMLPSDNVSDDFSRCQELGISAYLVKPIKELDLLNTVITVLGGKLEPKEEPDRVIPAIINERLRILVAEDNATSQLIAEKTLEKMGCVVQIASNGLEVVRIVEKREFDLILMDVEMPQMNGFEATRVIRRKEAVSDQHIPIIAMTAYAMKEDRDRCLEAGMDGYLSKPVNPESLYCTIKNLLLPERKPNSAPPVDLNTAMRVVGGDKDLLRKAVGVFLEQDSARLLEEIRGGLERQDAQAVRAATHAIKGAATSFGGVAVVDVALRLQEMGRKGDLKGAKQVAEELELELKRLAEFFSSRRLILRGA